MKRPTRPGRCSCSPGYLKVVVDAAMTVLTSELTWCTLGFGILNLSTAMLIQCRII